MRNGQPPKGIKPIPPATIPPPKKEYSEEKKEEKNEEDFSFYDFIAICSWLW